MININQYIPNFCKSKDAGHLTTKGEVGWMNRQDDKISDSAVITEMVCRLLLI